MKKILVLVLLVLSISGCNSNRTRTYLCNRFNVVNAEKRLYECDLSYNENDKMVETTWVGTIDDFIFDSGSLDILYMFATGRNVLQIGLYK